MISVTNVKKHFDIYVLGLCSKCFSTTISRLSSVSNGYGCQMYHTWKHFLH